MADMGSVVMGIADVIAGALILFAFGHHTLGIIFGILMIGKGGISFV